MWRPPTRLCPRHSALYTIGHRLENVSSPVTRDPRNEQIICECEMATRAMLENVMDTPPAGQLDDVRRQMRLGMGPCQAASAPSALVASRTSAVISTRTRQRAACPF